MNAHHISSVWSPWEDNRWPAKPRRISGHFGIEEYVSQYPILLLHNRPWCTFFASWKQSGFRAQSKMKTLETILHRSTQHSRYVSVWITCSKQTANGMRLAGWADCALSLKSDSLGLDINSPAVTFRWVLSLWMSLAVVICKFPVQYHRKVHQRGLKGSNSEICLLAEKQRTVNAKRRCLWLNLAIL